MGGIHQMGERRTIDLSPGTELSVTHEAARAFQQVQVSRIGKFATTEEAHVDVGRERMDVRECRVPDAGGPVAVVQLLSHVDSEPTHDLEPAQGDFTELAGTLVEPRVDGGVPSDRAELTVGMRLVPFDTRCTRQRAKLASKEGGTPEDAEEMVEAIWSAAHDERAALLAPVLSA